MTNFPTFGRICETCMLTALSITMLLSVSIARDPSQSHASTDHARYEDLVVEKCRLSNRQLRDAVQDFDDADGESYLNLVSVLRKENTIDERVLIRVLRSLTAPEAMADMQVQYALLQVLNGTKSSLVHAAAVDCYASMQQPPGSLIDDFVARLVLAKRAESDGLPADGAEGSEADDVIANATVAADCLANLGSKAQSALRPLQDLIKSSDMEISVSCARACIRIAPNDSSVREEVIGALIDKVKKHDPEQSDQRYLHFVGDVLAEVPEQSLPSLVALFDEESPEIRKNAYLALRWMHSDLAPVKTSLSSMLDDMRPDVRQGAMILLLSQGYSDVAAAAADKYMKHLCTHVESDFVESPTTKEDATSVEYFEEMLENAAKLPQKVARTSLLGAFKELRMRSNVDSKLAVVLRQLVDLELCSDLSNDELETAATSTNDKLRWAAREALVLRDNKSVAGVIVQECRSELLGFKGGVAKEEDIAAMFDRGFRVLSRSKNLVNHANEIVDILATAPASVVNKVVADWQFICPVNRKAEQVLAELLRGNNRSSWTLDQRIALVRSLTNASGKQSEVAKKEFAAVLGQLCNSELSAATEPALLQCLDGLDGVSASGDLAVALNKVAEDVRISHDLRLRACRRLIQNNAIGIQANEFLRSEWMELLATNHRAPVVGAQSYFSDVGTTDTLWRPMAIYALRDASDRSPEAADLLRVLRKSSIGEMRRCAMK